MTRGVLRSVLLLLGCLSLLLGSAASARAIAFDAEQEYKSIFVIDSGDRLGSGFALGQDCIVTNAHVIGDPERVGVTTRDGKRLSARVVALDETLDLAVLTVAGATFERLRAGDEQSLPVGSDVYAIGAPESLAYSLTRGVLSAKDRAMGEGTYLQFDAPINSGNSGGPLLNDAGQVIGVITLKLSDAEGIGMAIPMSDVRDYLASNGITTEGVGNVVGPVSGTGATAPASVPETSQTDSTHDDAVLSALELMIIAAVVLALAIAVVAVIFNRRRTVFPRLDETDRTDFDIEILE
jgi:serine protease Do